MFFEEHILCPSDLYLLFLAQYGSTYLFIDALFTYVESMSVPSNFGSIISDL